MKNQTKTTLLARAVALAAGCFLLPAALLAGCGAEPPSPSPEDVAVGKAIQDIARTPRDECKCLSPSGALTTVVCYDTCFGSLECGPATAPCAQVCEYSDPVVELGEKCETVGLAGGKEATGLCATDGVHGLPKRGGCCTDCIIESGRSITCGTGTGQCGDRLAACKIQALCTEKNSCLLPHCDSGDCTSLPVPIPVACEDTRGAEGACWGGKCCAGCMRPGEKAGQCIPLADQKPSNCGAAGQLCQNCDDGNVCNGVEGCKEGRCVPGPSECEPRNDCETVSCDAVKGCVHTPKNTGTCNDGNPCTENDACSAGECKGTLIVCPDDGNPCTTGERCQAGSCVSDQLEDDAPCDDGSSCTTGTVCTQGECGGGTGEICHDTTNPCLVSTCSGGAGTCVEEARADDEPCDDGNACTVGEICQTGRCSAANVGSVDCDDDNACTSDACDSDNGCEYTPIVAECVDGNVCTTNDACVDGECVGEPIDCAPLDSCHDAGTCDPDSGVCDDPGKADGAACGNGGECRSGSCEDEDVGAGGAGVGGSGPGGDAGAAGDDGAAGEAGADSMGGVGGDGGTGGLYDGEPFARQPKGCSCRTVGGTSPSSVLGLLAGLTLVGAVWRRRRWDIGA